MTDVAVALLAALACGLAGLAVPELVATLPGPAGDVATGRRLRARSALVAAASGAVVGGAVGVDWALLVLLPLVPVGAALALIDAHAHLLPTRLIWPALVVTVVLAATAALLAGDPAAFARAALAGAGVFAFFHVLWWVHPAGLGYGDVRLSAVVGVALGYLGWSELLVGVYSGFVLFVVVAVARAVRRRSRSVLRDPLPFGPFLLAGALVGVALGGHLVSG